MKDYQKLINLLETMLSPKRFHHCLRTAAHAKNIALATKEDPEQAFLAGLLHDCARDLTNQKLISEAILANIAINSAEKDNPILLHGAISAHWAKEKFDIKNKNILKAIRNHTNGSKKMSLLEKIIYIADFTEIERNFSEAKKVRKILKELSVENSSQKNRSLIDKAVEKKAQFMLRYARKNKWHIHESLLQLAKKSN